MRKAYKPTDQHRATVRAMISYGITQEEICLVLAICRPTLVKYFRREIDTASAEATAKVAGSLFNNATKQMSVTAQIFWLKARAKWRDNDPPDAKEEDGGRTITIIGGLPDG
jgi:hypothetical protein